MKLCRYVKIFQPIIQTARSSERYLHTFRALIVVLDGLSDIAENNPNQWPSCFWNYL